MNRSPLGLLGQDSLCNIISLHNLFTEYHIKSKIHYKSKNTSNNNYIPELMIAYSVFDDEFLLEWCKYFGSVVATSVTQFEPLIGGAKVLHNMYIHNTTVACVML